jgi:hypothetical protein
MFAFSKYYSATYLPANDGTNDLPNRVIMTAYRPGKNHGAEENATITNPFDDTIPAAVSTRNYYSTKFIPMASVVEGPVVPYIGNGKSSYMEDPRIGQKPEDITDQKIKNPLPSGELSEFGELLF